MVRLAGSKLKPPAPTMTVIVWADLGVGVGSAVGAGVAVGAAVGMGVACAVWVAAGVEVGPGVGLGPGVAVCAGVGAACGTRSTAGMRWPEANVPSDWLKSPKRLARLPPVPVSKKTFPLELKVTVPASVWR